MKLYREFRHIVVCVSENYFTIIPNTTGIHDIMTDPKYTNYIIPLDNNVFETHTTLDTIKFFKHFTKLDYEHNREIWHRRF